MLWKPSWSAGLVLDATGLGLSEEGRFVCLEARVFPELHPSAKQQCHLPCHPSPCLCPRHCNSIPTHMLKSEQPKSISEERHLAMINVRSLAPICHFLSRLRGGLTHAFIKHKAFGFAMVSLLICTELMDAEHIGLIKAHPESWWLCRCHEIEGGRE